MAKSRKHARKPALAGRKLIDLIGRGPKVLEVLDRHGVTFCAGCYLTLNSPLKTVAGYHAVPDARKFLEDLDRALKG